MSRASMTSSKPLMFEHLVPNVSRSARAAWERLTIPRRAVTRRRSVENELPDFLRFSGMSLRAGWSIRQVMSEAARRFSGPLGEELALAAGELATGLTIEQALRGLAERTGTRDAVTAAAVLGVAIRQGGDAAAALDTLATVASRRLALRREVESLTAQARFSAVVLGVLPVGFWLFFPGGAGPGALAKPLGWLVVLIGLALDGAGFAVLRWMAAPERLC